MTTSFRTRTLACALLATTALASPALAQTSGQPAYRNFDANGVDLVRGDYVLSFVEGSIGSDEAALPLIRRAGSAAGGASQWDGITFHMTTASGGGQTVTVTLGNQSERFTASNGSYSSSLALGSTLTAGGSQFIYTMRDGTRIVFADPTGNPNGGATNFCKGSGQPSCSLLPIEIASPDRKVVTLAWSTHEKCSTSFNPDGSLDCEYFWRLASVSNSFGYSIAFDYTTDSVPSSGPGADWYRRTGANFYNNAVSSAAQARVSYSYPANGVTDVTDMAGRTWRVSGASIRRPGASSDTTVVTTNGAGEVSSVTDEGVTTNYSRTVSGNTATMVVTDALNRQTRIVSDLAISRPTSVTDPLNRTTSFQHDPSGRLTRVTAPEGNAVQYTHDARGNVTETRAVAKPGSGLADMVTSAVFPADCFTPANCNSPTSTRDARGNVTHYEYDPTHGGLLKVTLPTPNPPISWRRPQTRFSYTLRGGEYRLTGISACQTLETCTGSPEEEVNRADEVKTSLNYDANGNLTSTSTGAGDGSLTATQTMSYDALGNLLTVDGALPGDADTTRFRYNGGRELVGTISPDPDGTALLRPRAVRNTFNASGLLTKVERGTVESQSDAHWTAMNPLEAVETEYDANARPVVQKLTAGGAIYSLSQTSYDPLGRPECTVQRMNREAFGSLPSSACTPGAEGSFGPDRIGRTVYDPAGQIAEVRTAVGTALEAVEIRSTYTGNGQVETATDGENNKTTYQYDGHDRLSRTLFPSPSKGSGTSNPNDYEQNGYDAASNRVSFRNRDGATIGFRYDNLNRLVFKDLPAERGESDVGYSYDHLSRLTEAERLRFTYDALGRKLTETGPHGTVTSHYDLAGRRTLIEYPNFFSVRHEHLVTGETTTIRDSGTGVTAGVVASFAYDDLGRRTSLGRGNGTRTTYGYDPASRLSQLSHDMAGTAYDVTLGFSYNPAGQIVERTNSNDAYAFTRHTSGTVTEIPNGLNQLVSRNGAAVPYDGKGNVARDPTTAGLDPNSPDSYGYGYSSENLLTQVNGPYWGGLLRYDPLMRLYDAGAGGRTAFSYDGENRIGEYYDDGQGIVHKLRVAHGPRVDEPLVTYDAENYWATSFLHADERGSIIALTDSRGYVTNVNRYDEDGNGSHAGRFGFAGQPYETVSELNYSRARMYNPRLGRFMQPDPIGYDDGMNMYAYAHGDPVNGRDPSGTDSIFGGPPSEEQLAALAAAEAERWKDYNPGPNTGSNELAAHSAALAERFFTSSVFVDVGGYYVRAKPGSCQDDPTCSAADRKWIPGVSIPVGVFLAGAPNQTPMPANENDKYGVCEIGYRICRAQSRMKAPAGTLGEYLEACRAAADFCKETDDNPKIKTNFTISYPDGSKIVFGPHGLFRFYPPPPRSVK